MTTLESWPRCPAAAAFFENELDAFLTANRTVADMAARLRSGAGVSLLSLVDHWTLPDTPALRAQLADFGLCETSTVDGDPVWEHPQARLPRVRLDSALAAPRLALAAENLTEFAEANGLPTQGQHGDPDSGYEEVRYPLDHGELAVVVRQGYAGFRPGELTPSAARALACARRVLRERRRDGAEADVLQAATTLIQSLVEELGVDRTTDEFFAAERDYYLTRNRAARWQYVRQTEMGFGWANHDHHTYRSSRPSFRALMQLWEQLGFVRRERFYAGAEAGWGAQICEHPVSRVVIFADVDMAPSELDIDFAATDLPPTSELGTIGLWCALHGSSIGKAGMHHIECEFDFVQAQANLEAADFPMMAPFTDLPMLKQAFSAAEIWAVATERIDALVTSGSITSEQAERFRTQGAPGSHIEVLQRWEGFKGFNKTGVSSIIRDTDARK
ncbi:MAG: hypothetical protein JWL77_6051 [Chthonomonadaceae bacterium]|nr:hypothetical protein [Chthonomonadaceae bacterium]